MNEYDKTIEEFWRATFLAANTRSIDNSQAAIWADGALAHYRSRFPEPVRVPRKSVDGLLTDQDLRDITLLTDQDLRDITSAVTYMMEEGCRTGDCETRCRQLLEKLRTSGPPPQSDDEADEVDELVGLSGGEGRYTRWERGCSLMNRGDKSIGLFVSPAGAGAIRVQLRCNSVIKVSPSNWVYLGPPPKSPIVTRFEIGESVSDWMFVRGPEDEAGKIEQ